MYKCNLIEALHLLNKTYMHLVKSLFIYMFVVPSLQFS